MITQFAYPLSPFLTAGTGGPATAFWVTDTTFFAKRAGLVSTTYLTRFTS